MPRRTVQFVQGEYYHIYNRGAGKGKLFLENENYQFALRRVARYSVDLGIPVIACCLMPNHYHLVLRQDGEQPAGLLPQRVFNSYTKAFNRRYGRSGTLFETRFKAIHVDEEGYLLRLCRYVHANPVKHGLVSRVERWPYSNYQEWIGTRARLPVDRDLVREFFPTPRDYQQFVLEYLAGLGKLPDEVEAYLL